MLQESVAAMNKNFEENMLPTWILYPEKPPNDMSIKTFYWDIQGLEFFFPALTLGSVSVKTKEK